MASSAYEQVLAVQAVDIRLRQLRHLKKNHPLKAELASVQEKLDKKQAEIISIQEEIADNNEAQLGPQKKIAELEIKRATADTKLYDGSVTASNELLTLQQEIKGHSDKQKELEDELLTLMEQAEDTDVRLTQAQADSKTVQTSLTGVADQLDVALQQVTADIKQTEVERHAAAEPAVPELLKRYEELADHYDGVAIARLVNGQCDGCHMRLSAVAIDQVAKMSDTSVVTCEECGRLLVR